MAAARNSWHRLVCADQIMTLLPVNILLLVAAESEQCTMYTLYIPWNIKTNRVSDGSSLKNTFYVGFWQWKPARLLTFIPCRFPLIPVPPTGFTGWRPNFAQSSGARSRNLQEFANWAAPPPVGCCWAAFHDNRTNRRALWAASGWSWSSAVCLWTLIDLQVGRNMKESVEREGLFLLPLFETIIDNISTNSCGSHQKRILIH